MPRMEVFLELNRTSCETARCAHRNGGDGRSEHGLVVRSGCAVPGLGGGVAGGTRPQGTWVNKLLELS